MISPLHIATVGGQPLRFFRTPLDDGRPDMPWHCVEDLHRCLGLNRDQRRIFLRKLKNSNWPTTLNRLEPRYGGALNAFIKMMPEQPQPYRSHEPWVNNSPEAVRRAMLEVRRWEEGTLDDFNRRLVIAQEELAPESDAGRLGTEVDVSELLREIS